MEESMEELNRKNTFHDVQHFQESLIYQVLYFHDFQHFHIDAYTIVAGS